MEVKIDMKLNIDKIKKELEKKVEVAMVDVGLEAEGDVKMELNAMVYDTPQSPSGYVRTGRLRGSITFRTNKMASDVQEPAGSEDGVQTTPKNGKSVNVGTNVEYAVYVHEGTLRMAPRRFLKDAIEKNAKKYQDIIQEDLSKE